jgi:hypothetical protein
MTIAAGAARCGDVESHEWVLRWIDFEDGGSVSVFECLLCGEVDHRGR